jgi:alpha-D-ribose 1-methylphosphonate 5-triphosphate synthase subunit PhnG
MIAAGLPEAADDAGVGDVDRDRRFELLARADPAPLAALAEEVLALTDVSVGTPPTVGTLMLRLREPVSGTVYNAGEVLVTEARVALHGHDGYALRLGRDRETALAAAVLDAAVAADHPLASRVAALLDDLAATERDRAAAAWREVAPTRVVFDEMR